MRNALSLFAAILAGFATGALTSFSLRRGVEVNTSGIANTSTAAVPPVPPTSTRARSVARTALTDDERFGKIASALQETTALKRQHELYEALAELDAASMRDVVSRAEKLSPQYSFLMSPLLDRWFTLDKNAAIAWVRAHPNRREGWIAWARNSPETALAEVHAHPQSSMARDTLREAVWALVGKEKPAVAAKLAVLGSDPGRDSLLSQTISDWAKEDPKAAFLFAKNLPDARRMITLQDVPLRLWIQSEPERAKEEVEALARDTPNRSRALGLIASVSEALAENNPVRALEWLNGLPEDCRGAAPYLAIAASWSAADPVGALEWCAANGIDAAAGAQAGGWGGNAVILQAIAKHPDETLRWLEALPHDANRDALLERALMAQSKWTAANATSDDGQRTLALMTTLPRDAQERVAYYLGMRQAEKRGFQDVRGWIVQFEDPELRAAAIEAFTQSSSRRQTEGARTQKNEQLLAEFTQDAERDAVFRGIVSLQEENSPQTAAETALQISDRQKRHDALDDFVIDWLHRDPRGARQWLTDPSRIPTEWSAGWIAEAERTR